MASIKTGDFEVIESGCVQILSSADTVITFEDINIVFSFETSVKEDTGIVLRLNENNANEIRFILRNINRPSYGTIDFIKFGSLGDGKDIYISFRVNSLDDKKVWTLEYTIFKK